MLRRAAAASALTTLLLLTGCGSEGNDAAGPADPPSTALSPTPASPTSAPDQSPKAESPGTTVEISFSGDTVKPLAARAKAAVGKPVTLRISADAPGELHVHSSPEQMVGYPKGESTRKLTFDRPGVVEVESHDLNKLIVQLEVR